MYSFNSHSCRFSVLACRSLRLIFKLIRHDAAFAHREYTSLISFFGVPSPQSPTKCQFRFGYWTLCISSFSFIRHSIQHNLKQSQWTNWGMFSAFIFLRPSSLWQYSARLWALQNLSEYRSSRYGMNYGSISIKSCSNIYMCNCTDYSHVPFHPERLCTFFFSGHLFLSMDLSDRCSQCRIQARWLDQVQQQ